MLPSAQRDHNLHHHPRFPSSLAIPSQSSLSHSALLAQPHNPSLGSQSGHAHQQSLPSLSTTTNTNNIISSININALAPSLSRFLSHSIINPLADLRHNFASATSENPLFYSTQEGYEIGLTGDDDILPREDDERLFRSEDPDEPSGRLGGGHRALRGRGIDEDMDQLDSYDHFRPSFTSQPPSQFLSSRPDPCTLPSNQPSVSRPALREPPSNLVMEDDGNDNPFYCAQTLRQPPPPSQAPPQHDLPLPRHIMASRALSNLMASEMAPRNHLPYYSDNAPVDPARPSESQGWNMYQTVNLQDSLCIPSSSIAFDQAPLFTPAPVRLSTHLQPKPPEQPAHQRPEPAHYTLAQPLPRGHPAQDPQARSHLPAAHTQQNTENQPGLGDLPLTLFIYPTEARDIGSEVSGGSPLGPQTYRDSIWLAAWLFSLVYASLQSIWVVFMSSTKAEDASQRNELASRRTSLMSSLPVLSFLITLTLGFCFLSLSLLVMVKRAIRALVYGTVVGVPLVLSMIALWTWAQSLSHQSEQGQGFMSMAAIVVSCVFMKFMWSHRKRIDRTIRVLELSTGVIIEHPSLVVVSLALTMSCILMSLPFITVVYQLLLNGYYDRTRWVINTTSITQFLVTAFVWSWTLNVIRALQKIIIAGVVSHWYFNRHSPPGPHQKQYSGLETTYGSVARALGPSLGTVCLSGFLLTCFDMASKLLKALKRITPQSPNLPQSGVINFLIYYNPISSYIWSWVGPIVGLGVRMTEFLNGYSILYCGITGFKFWESSRKVGTLMCRNGQVSLANNLLVKMLLNLCSGTLSVTAGLIGYQLLTHQQGGLSRSTGDQPSEGDRFLEAVPMIVVFSGLLPFWIIRFVTDLISNSVDTLFLCWNIDLDIGTNHSSKTQEAFVGGRLLLR